MPTLPIKHLLLNLVEAKLAYDEAVRALEGHVLPGTYSVPTNFGRATYHVQVYAFNTPDVRGPVSAT